MSGNVERWTIQQCSIACKTMMNSAHLRSDRENILLPDFNKFTEQSPQDRL